MDKITEIAVTPMFNLDFIYYLIYLFFKKIGNFFLNEPTDINFINVFRYVSDGTVLDTDKYMVFGNGIGSLYDGYSLFRPPQGLESFSGFSGWLDNFFTNPYCAECPSFFDLFFGGVNFFIYLLIGLGIVFLFLIKIKDKELSAVDSLMHDTVYEKNKIEQSNKKAARWDKILSLINSNNQNDWVVAIIDADNLLEEALEDNGYYGNSVGERLKNANFCSINNAWKAHKIRNEIAHNPSFQLSQRDAKIAISNFGQVFSEFYHL